MSLAASWVIIIIFFGPITCGDFANQGTMMPGVGMGIGKSTCLGHLPSTRPRLAHGPQMGLSQNRSAMKDKRASGMKNGCKFFGSFQGPWVSMCMAPEIHFAEELVVFLGCGLMSKWTAYLLGLVCLGQLWICACQFCAGASCRACFQALGVAWTCLSCPGCQVKAVPIPLHGLRGDIADLLAPL